MLVLHYTGMEDAGGALARLCDRASHVSAHYLIDEDGGVHRLVDESNRAWHAGLGFWRGERDINGRSIGIELANPGHEFGYREFPELQMQALIDLSRDILGRHTIPARNVVGHSDIAPDRKLDPGEFMDWPRLAEARIGLWPQEAPEPSENPRGGKSGLHGNTVPGNARRGRPQGKCHRKQTAPPAASARKVAGVRVKGCGKSAPRPRQRGRHGKPHREQDRIGTVFARFRAAVRVGRTRRPATDVPDEWPSHSLRENEQNPAYRPSGIFKFRHRPHRLEHRNRRRTSGVKVSRLVQDVATKRTYLEH